MKTAIKWLSVPLITGVFFIVFPSKAYAGGLPSQGVDLILDADISQDDETLISNAIQLNGSPAVREEEVPAAKEEDKLFMVGENVTSKLNVRETPDKDGKTVGALYLDCGGEVIERKDGWSLIRSGNLEGWAKDEFLLFGDEARSMAAEVGATLATVQVNGLQVRVEPSKSSKGCGILAQGEKVSVFELDGDYIGIEYEGGDGYIAAEYVKIDFIIDNGETNEEIEERIREEELARERAKADAAARKEYLAKQQEEISSTYSELQMLAAIIYCEAGNQEYDGQVAVGAVVINRVKSLAYPDSIPSVIFASGQFSPVMTGSFKKSLEKGTYQKCLQAATDALNGVSPVGDCTHFRRKGTKEGIIIGAHVFY